MNVSGSTSINGRGIRSMGKRALCECHVSGSKIGVAYNSRWLESEPAVEVISCLGDAIPLLTNGMANEVVVSGYKWTLVLKATISSEAECLALIWCLVWKIRECGDWMEVEEFRDGMEMKVDIFRGGRLVVESSLFPTVCGSDGNHVCLWTLRREHQLVQSLRHGDKACAYVRSFDEEEYTVLECIVLEGAVCVVCHEDEKVILTNNSEVLSKSQSEDFGNAIWPVGVGG